MRVIGGRHSESDQSRATARRKAYSRFVRRPEPGSSIWTRIFVFFGCIKQQEHSERETTVRLNVSSGDGDVFETFGMKICTSTLTQADGSCVYVQKVSKVSKDSAATQMKIRDGDEIVLINDKEFAPCLSHQQLIDLFRSVNVDGKSRFSLVLHRQRNSSRVWVNTSAILAPDKVTGDNKPILEKTRVYKSTKETYTSESKNIYQISGEQLYLEIHVSGVTANAMTGSDTDKFKIICRLTKIRQNQKDKSVYTYEAALCDTEKQHYISIDGGRITLKSHEVWLDMQTRGGDIHFQKKEWYLAYDDVDNVVSVKNDVYWFKEFPADSMMLHLEARHSDTVVATEHIPLEDQTSVLGDAANDGLDIETIVSPAEDQTGGKDDEPRENVEKAECELTDSDNCSFCSSIEDIGTGKMITADSDCSSTTSTNSSIVS